VAYANFQYGSSYEGLERAWEKSPLITIVLDTAGAKTYADKLGDEAVIIFLTVTKTDEILGRLSKRGDNLEEMRQRLTSQEYQRDIQLPTSLQDTAHVVVNDDWQSTKMAIDRIVKQAVVVEPEEE
jgi:guanylate kinase